MLRHLVHIPSFVVAAIEFRRVRVCLACAAPTAGPDLCPACVEAFSLAKAAHPASESSLPAAAGDDATGTAPADMEFWDAWALLGDVGADPRRCGER